MTVLYKAKRSYDSDVAGRAVRVCMVGPDRATYDALIKARGSCFDCVELVGYASSLDRLTFPPKTDTLLLEVQRRHAALAAVRQWRQHGHTTNVLVAMDNVTDDLLVQLRREGVAYVMYKPMPAAIMLRRLYQFGRMDYVSGAAMATDGRTLKLEQRIIQLLDALSVPAELSGYRYFVTAATIMLRGGDSTHVPIISLYENVANKHKTGAAAVERAMRYALEVTWLRGNVDTINDLFGYTVCPEKGKPTNALFISRLVDYIRLTASGT